MPRNDEPRTLRDLLRERHARGGAAAGGRLVPQPGPDGNDSLAYIRHEPRPPLPRDGRQVRPTNDEGDRR